MKVIIKVGNNPGNNGAKDSACEMIYQLIKQTFTMENSTRFDAKVTLIETTMFSL